MPPQPKAAYHWLHIVGLLKAVGLFSCSVSGHSTFSTVRATLADPNRFQRVIYNSFTIMFLAYGAIAAVGYWYFGDGLQPLIINNMVNGSVYNNIQLIGNLDVGRVTSLLVGLRAYTVFPAIVVVLQVGIVHVLRIDAHACAFYRILLQQLVIAMGMLGIATCAREQRFSSGLHCSPF